MSQSIQSILSAHIPHATPGNCPNRLPRRLRSDFIKLCGGGDSTGAKILKEIQNERSKKGFSCDFVIVKLRVETTLR